MRHYPTLHLIIGKWRTPLDSSRKENDDTHKVKKDILKQIGKKNFQKKVGNNPDLDINQEGVIILKGTGEYSRKPYYVTNISADDHFVIRFVPIQETQELEIQILTLLQENKHSENKHINLIANLNRLYIIPSDEDLIVSLIDRLSEKYLASDKKDPTVIFVLLSEKIN